MKSGEHRQLTTIELLMNKLMQNGMLLRAKARQIEYQIYIFIFN